MPLPHVGEWHANTMLSQVGECISLTLRWEDVLDNLRLADYPERRFHAERIVCGDTGVLLPMKRRVLD